MADKVVEMKLFWRPGTDRPKEDGIYVAFWFDHVITMGFTVEYGWNTFSGDHDNAIDDKYVKAWADVPIEELKKKTEGFA